jgi:hypothetical protein
LQVAACDFNITVFSQLAATQLALGNPFKARALKVISCQAALRVWALLQEALKDAAGEPDNALVLADGDAELNRLALVIPASIFGKGEEHSRAPGREASDVPYMF